MSTEELIAKARALLEGTSPAPWKLNEYSLDASNRYEVIAIMVGCSDQDRRLIEAAPNIIRELVEALEAAVATAELRYEWSQYYSEKYQEAKSLNERDPNEPR